MRRLVLFDIDGTLVTGGPAKEAFHVALVESFGTTGAIEVHEFAGKTDPQIARELLTGVGRSDREIDAGLPALFRRYLEELEARLQDRPVEVLPGVADLLDALEASGEAALGLVTGNVAGGATLKLGSAGLAERFPVGGFGSDHELRDRLPDVAIGRARAHYGIDFAEGDVVIVGDTPLDVACGRHAGCCTVAVATGTFAAAALEGAGADHVFADLSATEALLAALLGRG